MRLTFGQRLAQAIEASPYDQKTVAEKIGASESQVSRWVRSKGNDESAPQGRFLVQLPKLLDISGHWLLTGEGEMRPLPPPEANWRLLRVRSALEEPYPAGESGVPMHAADPSISDASKSKNGNPPATSDDAANERDAAAAKRAEQDRELTRPAAQAAKDRRKKKPA
jgi:transcriptional regulator with XRE-family HTH domain